MINSVFNDLTERVKKHEGFRERPYLDSLGVGTVGYGFTYLKKDECEVILNSRLRECAALVEGYLNNEGISLDEFRTALLTEMCFQVGFKGLLGFKKMFKALRVFDYEAAAAEMKSSRWFKQTPVRAGDLSDKMARGF